MKTHTNKFLERDIYKYLYFLYFTFYGTSTVLIILLIISTEVIFSASAS